MKNSQVLTVSLIFASAAFVIVSVLVTITGGKNKYLISGKLRLGAIIIGMTGVVNSCVPMATCYKTTASFEPSMDCINSADRKGCIILKPEDRELKFDCAYLFYDNLSYRIFHDNDSVCGGICNVFPMEDVFRVVINLPSAINTGEYDLKVFYTESDESGIRNIPLKEFKLRVED